MVLLGRQGQERTKESRCKGMMVVKGSYLTANSMQGEKRRRATTSRPERKQKWQGPIEKLPETGSWYKNHNSRGEIGCSRIALLSKQSSPQIGLDHLFLVWGLNWSRSAGLLVTGPVITVLLNTFHFLGRKVTQANDLHEHTLHERRYLRTRHLNHCVGIGSLERNGECALQRWEVALDKPRPPCKFSLLAGLCAANCNNASILRHNRLFWEVLLVIVLLGEAKRESMNLTNDKSTF